MVRVINYAGLFCSGSVWLPQSNLIASFPVGMPLRGRLRLQLADPERVTHYIYLPHS